MTPLEFIGVTLLVGFALFGFAFLLILAVIMVGAARRADRADRARRKAREREGWDK